MAIAFYIIAGIIGLGVLGVLLVALLPTGSRPEIRPTLYGGGSLRGILTGVL